MYWKNFIITYDYDLMWCKVMIVFCYCRWFISLLSSYILTLGHSLPNTFSLNEDGNKAYYYQK